MTEREHIYVVVGLLGLLLHNVEVYTDRDKAFERARYLAKHEYDCMKPGGVVEEKENHFWATNWDKTNEVHCWTVPLDSCHVIGARR